MEVQRADKVIKKYKNRLYVPKSQVIIEESFIYNEV